MKSCIEKVVEEYKKSITKENLNRCILKAIGMSDKDCIILIHTLKELDVKFFEENVKDLESFKLLWNKVSKCYDIVDGQYVCTIEGIDW